MNFEGKVSCMKLVPEGVQVTVFKLTKIRMDRLCLQDPLVSPLYINSCSYPHSNGIMPFEGGLVIEGNK